MTPERWQQVKETFHAALALATDERATFLAEACRGDDSLRQEIESLIRAYEETGKLVDAPAYEALAELAADAQELTAGQTIGHYSIVSSLGKGGMGEVYLARDGKLRRNVALKLLPTYLAKDSSRLRRFEQEAHAVSALNHPNILTIYEIGETDSSRFIVTEFIDGVTLRQRMAQSALDLDEALDIAIDVASALVAAHRVQIVHRDIKPENIMVRRDDGLVKVLDFGLAKAAEKPGAKPPDSEAATKVLVNTAPGVVMGTVAYMSPEQARGLAADERTDIWSLGVVLYEMVTGKVPFVGTNTNEIISAILSKEEPAPLALFANNLPAELDRIVSKAITKDREERYQTTKDLLIDLKRFRQKLEVDSEIKRSIRPQANSGVEATTVSGQATASSTQDAMAQTATVATPHPTTSAEYIVTEIKRHKRSVLLALTVFIIGGAVVGYWLYKFIGKNKQALSTGSLKMVRLTSTGKALNVAISPDGKYVVYALDQAGQQSLWLSQVAVAGQNQIVEPDAVIYLGITFSVDGNFIYYVKQKVSEPDVGVLYQVPTLGGGAERKLVVNVNSPVTFSPDGKRLAFVRGYPANPSGDALIVANADGTEEKVLLTRKQPSLLSRGGPSWSPDAEMIACGTQNRSGRSYSNVVGVRVADGTEIPITSKQWPGGSVDQVAWLSTGDDLMVTASEQLGGLNQIWLLSSSKDEARQIVSDLNGYSYVSQTADSSTLATTQIDRLYNIWVAPVGDASRIKQVTSGTGRQDGVAGLNWTPDDRIVYRSNAGGQPNIWIIGTDASGNRQLTSSGSNGYPAVTPDGRYLIWLNYGIGTGVSQVWRMDIDGGNPKQLTSGEGIGPLQLSPDGKWVVYGSSGAETMSQQIWKVSIDGGDPFRLTEKPSAAPVVSPDGKLIACNWLDKASGQWKIGILPFEGGEPTKIFDIPGIQNRQIHWTPDSRAVSFVRSRQGVSNIWAQPLDGGEPEQLTDFKDQRIVNFAWSRDGKQLALSRGVVNSDVVLISGFK